MADSLESMQSLADALAKSKSKSKKDDVKLCETIAEVIPSFLCFLFSLSLFAVLVSLVTVTIVTFVA